MSFAHTVRTTASKDRVWALWQDVGSWPSWDTDLEYSKFEGPFTDGVSGLIKSKSSKEKQFTITKVYSNGFEHVIHLPLAKIDFDHYVTDDEETDGVLVTHSVTFRGLLGWFYAITMKRKYKETLPKALIKLINQAESL